ncbi:MAG TPA: carboxypeptidase-like regulatory domain-containing protein [Verrucomicrobiota bacterium]|nr:carboxypeptidase-like regulatory domain-containing protein [Verrucomicrobiota bacterium]
MVNDQTGAPIDRFRIFVGANGDDHAVEKSGDNGTFSLTLLGSESSIEVRSPGYQPSRQELTLNGPREVSFEFRLTASTGWSGFVRFPNGQPAVGVEVALMTADKRATLGDRRLLWRDQANVTTSDADGSFHFEPEPAELPVGRVLVAVHVQGYAEKDADQFAPGSILTLQPWGRVEGVVQGRSTYPPELKVHLLIRSWNPWMGLSGDADHFSKVPNDRGEFTIAHVPPGFYSIGLLPSGSGAIDKRLTFQVLPGRTSQIELSDEGRIISGRLVAPDLPPDFDFSRSTATLERRQVRPVDLPRVRFKDFPDAPSYERAAQEQTPKLISYWQSAEGVSAWLEQRTYAVRLNSDGTLTGRAIPPGDYDLKVMAWSRPPGQAGNVLTSNSLKLLKSVEAVRIDAAVDGGVGNGAVELGSITLGKAF